MDLTLPGEIHRRDVMLALHDVHVSFDAAEVLTGVNCEFHAGQIIGLIGNNGAGKTTLLRTATTMLAPQRGQVTLGDRVLMHEDVNARCQIGALIEKPGHYDELSVRENLNFFYSFHCTDRRARRTAVAESITRFRLTDVAGNKVGKLSTGYRQRVAVARAFHPKANIVLLDEPLAGLDPTTRTGLKDTLRESAQDGTAICLSSHGLGDLEALCDRLYVVVNGITHLFSGFDEIRNRVGLGPEQDLDVVYARLTTVLSETS